MDKIIDLFEIYQTNTNEALEYYLENYSVPKVHRSRNRNIAFFYHVLGKGGVQRVIQLMIPILKGKGYNIVLITEEEKQSTDYDIPDDVKRFVIQKRTDAMKNADYSLRAKQLEKILLEEEVDIVCYEDAQSKILLYDFLIVNACNVHFVLHKHQVFSWELTLCRNYYFEQKKLYQLFDKVVVLTQEEEVYWNRLGINAIYIPNPISESVIKVLPVKRDYIVWVGRLDITSKRYFDLIPIMQKVVEAYPHCKLKMFGSGDESTVAYLQKKIQESNLQNNIIYCGYSLDLEEIYSAAQIQVSVSLFENFPMNIYEGKGYGIPLVTYCLPYVELLKEEKGQITVPQGDIQAAADAIIKILSNEQLEEKLRKESRKSIEKFRDIDIGEQWANVFNEINMETLDKKNLVNLENVFDIIYRHCNYFQEEYMRLSDAYRQLGEKHWLQTIQYRVLKDHMDVAIYPYGKVGKQIKKLLNDNGIIEKYIIDNNLCKENEKIISLDELDKESISNLLFVVCSSSRSGYYEIRKPLYKLADKKNIIDKFTEEELFQRRI